MAPGLGWDCMAQDSGVTTCEEYCQSGGDSYGECGACPAFDDQALHYFESCDEDAALVLSDGDCDTTIDWDVAPAVRCCCLPFWN